MAKKTVFVGISGGVDSSVSAGLLKKAGYNVIGVHIKCWNVDGCADIDAEDARRAAETLSIPFYVFDFEKEYKERVVEYMVEGYKSGITPNPDVMCNHEIKFGLFFERAMQMGADYVATGHYARVAKRSGKHALLPGLDKNKDQSYFLWLLTERQLAKTIFPIGGLKKLKVRQLARRFNLPNAEKKDSQGVCFLGQISLEEFLSDFIPRKKGKIIGEGGEVLGTHPGVHNFTIGQRHGLGVGGFSEPQYVAQKDIKANTVLLTPRKDRRTLKKEIILMDTNFLVKIRKSQKVLVRFRYRQKLQKATLMKEGKAWKIVFDKKQEFIATGQSAVIYDLKGERLLAGGVIKKSI